jgi:acetylornithine deacetylase/succinyl-diaminopimelate desuccinylase-like protein
MWRSLPFDEPSFARDELGADELTGEQGYSPLERMWARPTLDVHGMPGGFTGEGAKTVIPGRASAKISMRLVPGQDSARIFSLFRDHVQHLTPPGVRVAVHLYHGDDAVVVASDSRWIRAARQALQETFGREAVLTRSGGSIPIVGLFKQALGIDSVLMGWGLSDDNLHAPNEKLSLSNFYAGIDATIRFWEVAAHDGV